MFRITAYDRDGRQVAVCDAQGGEVTIGREMDRRLCLASPSVSRRHARVVLDGPQPFIVDEGSANGVLVNGVRIGGPTALAPGVRIDIAEFWLDFAVMGAPVVAAPAPYAAAPYQGAPAAAQPAAYGAAVAAPGTLRLRAQGGPFAGRGFDIPSGRVSIGRAIDNHLVFDDPSLSRKHAVVQQTARDRLELQDLGSSNGTWLNGRKVDTAMAVAGDSIRFGDLMFALEGEGTDAVAAPYTDPAPGGYDEPAPGRPRWPLIVGVGVGMFALAAVVVFFALRGPGKPSGGAGGGPESLASIAEQVETHLKAGRDKLDAKQFDAAIAEFDEVLKLDPTNAEAKSRRLLAVSEPDNDKQSRKIVAKASLGQRTDLEAAAKMVGQLPAESAFHDPTAQKVAGKLVAFGDAQCKAKRYLDCAWALCRALEVVPAEARAQVVPAAAEAQMREAEKKAAKEKGFVPCRRK